MPNKFFHNLIFFLKNTFWLVPGVVVCLGIFGAIGLIEIDRSGLVSTNSLIHNWLYNGGGTGARTLLGSIAASTIGVAGTVFSITIAALSLTAGQMGPRLLRNFTQDRGNQMTLGIFLGTFSYSLMVLRSVREQHEGVFVPHLSLTVGVILAIVCVGMLVYFVGHMSRRISVDTVIDLVSEEVSLSFEKHTIKGEQEASNLSKDFWTGAKKIIDIRKGYLRHLDYEHLASWGAKNNTSIQLLVRPGEYVFPGTPIALIQPMVAGAYEAIVKATELSSDRTSNVDLEFSIRQLVEVAVRALSPGINDPYTAINVLNRLGGALCEIKERELPDGLFRNNGKITLIVPTTNYDGLTDSMFHMIRQSAAANPAVLIRMTEVLIAVAESEPRKDRRETLSRHASLVYEDSNRTIKNIRDLGDAQNRYQIFISTVSP